MVVCIETLKANHCSSLKMTRVKIFHRVSHQQYTLLHLTKSNLHTASEFPILLSKIHVPEIIIFPNATNSDTSLRGSKTSLKSTKNWRDRRRSRFHVRWRLREEETRFGSGRERVENTKIDHVDGHEEQEERCVTRHTLWYPVKDSALQFEGRSGPWLMGAVGRGGGRERRG